MGKIRKILKGFKYYDKMFRNEYNLLFIFFNHSFLKTDFLDYNKIEISNIILNFWNIYSIFLQTFNNLSNEVKMSTKHISHLIASPYYFFLRR
jgi:hypothetical protein